MVNNFHGMKKNIMLSLVIILAGLFVVGGTYAALLVTLNLDVTNGVYNTTLECFDIDYDGGNGIYGTLVPSKLPTGGLNGTLSLGVNNACSVSGIGNLDLIVKSNGDKDEILMQVVDAHCEDITTLETLTDSNRVLLDQTACSNQSNAIWVTNGTALKYAVYIGESTVPSSVGYINDAGVSFDILSGFNVSVLTNYKVYVWLDGNLSDNSYSYISFSGEIDTSVTQVES